LRGEPVTYPTGRQVLDYLNALREAIRTPDFREASLVQAMKRYVTQVALGAEPTGAFLDQIRRAATLEEYNGICTTFLDHDRPLPLEPFPVPLKPCDVLGGSQE
jgi:hypothetical protein